MSLTLAGLDLSQLLLNEPICLPMAFIVGDDDGFSGTEITSPPPAFKSRRLVVPKKCTANTWPWIQS